MNNVICVYTGTKYNITHVNTLYNMVERNLSQPFNFYCLTNNQGQKFHKNITNIDHGIENEVDRQNLKILSDAMIKEFGIKEEKE